MCLNKFLMFTTLSSLHKINSDCATSQKCEEWAIPSITERKLRTF